MQFEDSLLEVGQEILSVGLSDPFDTDLITKEPTEVVKDIKEIPDKETKKEDIKSSDSKEDATKDVTSKTVSDTSTQPEETKKPNAALFLAESFKKDGVLPEDLKFEEQMTAKDLKRYLVENAISDAESLVRSEYEKKYGEETLKAAEYLSQGIDPEEVKEITFYKKISSTKLGDDEEQNAQIKEFVVKSMYREKGIKENRIEKLYSDSLDEDDADSEFEEAKKYFSEKVKSIEKGVAEELSAKQEADKRAQEAINKEIRSEIKSGNIYGVTDDISKKNLESFLFDQNETVKIDGKVYKVTGFQKAKAEFDSDLKKQLTFAKLLMGGFDLSSIEESGKSKASEELDALLEGTITATVNNKEGDSNNYNIDFDDPVYKKLL